MGDDRLDGADVCPACLAELSDGKSFCPACNAPVSPTAAISPFERVFAEGYIYRQAVSSPRKLIVIVGVWCIFLSLLGSGIAMVAYEYLYGPYDLMFLVEAGFLMVVGSLGLYHATRNYIARPPDKTVSETDAP